MVPETAAGQRRKTRPVAMIGSAPLTIAVAQRDLVARGGPLVFIQGLLPLQWPQNAGTGGAVQGSAETGANIGLWLVRPWQLHESCRNEIQNPWFVIPCPTYNIITAVIAARRTLDNVNVSGPTV
jgi:hypothetical protein